MKQSDHDEMDLVKLKATMREYGCNYFGTHYPDYEGLYKIFIDLALHTMIRLIYSDNAMINSIKKTTIRSTRQIEEEIRKNKIDQPNWGTGTHVERKECVLKIKICKRNNGGGKAETPAEVLNEFYQEMVQTTEGAHHYYAL